LNTTQAIKEQAYRLGFSLVGVATPGPLPHADVFETWLQCGRHGEMTYLNTPRSRLCRSQPKQILPECRSVVVLGIRYPAPPTQVTNDLKDMPHSGKIAAYAQGNDYHNFLPERLQSLVRFIETRVGHPVLNRWYTDTGPLLERELAQRAGLGWIGKNTCLINPRKGSYFLLAEILLGIELEPDRPFTKDHCGTCMRCITACPTGCILPDRTLDSRRCISYLTIEFKGFIPRELRPLMETWVFGCDICQQACPWNRFTTADADPIFDRHMVLSNPDLLDELRLTTGEFNHKYRHSPIMRSKRIGYIRNVSVVLGNTQRREAIPALAQTLMADKEPVVRAHAAWALGRIKDGLATKALEMAANAENELMVKVEIQNSLEIQ